MDSSRTMPLFITTPAWLQCAPGAPNRLLIKSAYHTKDLVSFCREKSIAPHTAIHEGWKIPGLDARTTRPPSYEISQRKRKLMEQKLVGENRMTIPQGTGILATRRLYQPPISVRVSYPCHAKAESAESFLPPDARFSTICHAIDARALGDSPFWKTIQNAIRVHLAIAFQKRHSARRGDASQLSLPDPD